MSYLYDRYYFHVLATPCNSDGDAVMVYMCMAGESFKKRTAFELLEATQRALDQSMNGLDLSGMHEHALQKACLPTLEKLLDKYNAPEADVAGRTRAEIDETRNLMIHNIERVLERGEHLDNLLDRTADLQSTAFAYRKRSTLLRRRMWWKNARLMASVAGVCVLGSYFVVGQVCGFPAWSQCF